MNDAQIEIDTANQTSLPRALFWLMSLAPALSFLFIPFSPVLSQAIGQSFSPLAGKSSFIQLLSFFIIPSVLAPMLVAFVITFIFPMVVNRRDAILFAIPAFIAHLYIYSIWPFFDPRVIESSNFWGGFGFQLRWTLTIFIPLGILAFLGTALFSRLGSRVKSGQ